MSGVSSVRDIVGKYKKMFENEDIYFFTYLHESSKYHHVRYLRFNKPSGILIVHEDGTLPSRKDAEFITAQFNFYNNIVVGVGKDLVREKERNIEPIHEVYRLLEPRTIFFEQNIELSIAFKEIIQMLRTIIDGQSKLKVIYNEMEQIDKNSRGKHGYITKDDVDRFLELNELYQSTLYSQGRVQKDNEENIKYLLNNIKSITSLNKIEIKRIKDVLGHMNHLNIKQTREKSLATFEMNASGKRLNFDSGEKGIQQMLGNYRDFTTYELEKNLISILRNP